MVNKKMYRRIQDLKKKGYGKSQITKHLKLDPATVRKYFYMEPEEYTAYFSKTSQRRKHFDVYKDEILTLYEENQNHRLNMSAVYDFLEEKFFQLPSGEKSLRNYIHHLENTGVLQYSSKPREYQKVPELPYGKQMQLDFGEYKFRNGLKLYIFGTLLSASRFKYVSLQDKPFKTLDVIHHLLDCFDYFGGIPEELVIDQDSLMVVDENYGDIVYTKQFKVFLEEMNLKMFVCRKADPETKGKIENLIKYVKYNFLQVRNFEDIETARESLRKWLSRRANGKICQSTRKVPLLAIGEERQHLRPLRNSIYRKDSFVGRQQRTVSEKSCIMFNSNEYSVPTEYRQRMVEIYITEDELYIFDEYTGRELACHELSVETGKRVIDKTHFRNNSQPVTELERETGELFDFEAWEIFIEKNHQTYSRYFRDQCLLARKFFTEVSEPAIFEMSVDYCLQNSTYAMTALQDTYNYHLKEHEEDRETIKNIFPAVFQSKAHEEPDISQRSIHEYEDAIVSRVGGVK